MIYDGVTEDVEVDDVFGGSLVDQMIDALEHDHGCIGDYF